MTNSPYVRSALAVAALELVPPLIRKDLIGQKEFRSEYGIESHAVLSFGDTGVSIPRSELFEAVRSVLSGRPDIDLNDVDGRNWKLEIKSKPEELLRLSIYCGEQRFNLPDFTALSPDRGICLRSLEEAASHVNLPANATGSWRDILSDRALEDEEVDEFHSDFRDTPVHVAGVIREEIAKGTSRLSSLVPSSRRYFERLIGAYDGAASIAEYAAGRGKEFLEGLSAWQPYDGFLFSLFLSSHSSLTAEISVQRLEGEDLVRAFEFLEKFGDRVSQLGAIEVGLRVLADRPEVEPIVIRLIEQIRDDGIDGSAGGFKLLSALFVLVDGELSRTRVLSETPPFYRRLASLSQAALIHRQVVRSRIEIDSFCEWALKNRAEQFYFQSLADLRLEPRWDPDFAAASQLKADFFGRLMNAAKSYEKNIGNGSLRDLLSGTDRGSLLSLSELPRPYFPGPLEGGAINPNVLPSDFAEAVKNQLSAEEVGPASFIALVNSALLFRVESNQAELAAEVLKLGSHRLANIEGRSQLLAVLNGLATVAAVAREQALADELRILVRRYRRDTQYALSIDEALRVCLVASASRADLHGWRNYVGDWLTELAFDELKDHEGRIFHSCLQCLLHAVPELWVSCARGDAALAAFNAR